MDQHLMMQQENYKPNIPQFQVNSFNWRGILYASSLVAVKYWEDKYFWNIDVVRKLNLFNIKYTN